MICPACKNCKVDGKPGSRECPECGAFEKDNQRGNSMWMKDGEVIQCLVEEDEAEEKARKYNDDTERALKFLKEKLQE